MKIIVLNCGSSSLKYQLLDMKDEQVLAKGLVERIGMSDGILTHKPQGKEPYKLEKQNIRDHKIAIQMVFAALTDSRHGVLSNINEINGIGHRVAHGGELFRQSTLIDAKVREGIYSLISMAPLHNPANLQGIDACSAVMPEAPQVAVFDTAFHQTISQTAYTYAIPYRFYEKHGVRRYGFHGQSHQYVSQRAAKMLGRPIQEIKIVSCHLGNGSSVTANRGGQSVDTSMGFTPLEGLVMGTRCGDIDPAIIPFLVQAEGLSAKEVADILNKESGVLGLSGLSSDFRDLENAAEEGNLQAQLALDVFCYRVKKYVGAYAAVLNGIDALVFTAGIGERSCYVREVVCQNMEYLGLKIDLEKNKLKSEEVDISAEGAKNRILVIPTNEELMIARDTNVIVANSR